MISVMRYGFAPPPSAAFAVAQEYIIIHIIYTYITETRVPAVVIAS